MKRYIRSNADIDVSAAISMSDIEKGAIQAKDIEIGDIITISFTDSELPVGTEVEVNSIHSEGDKIVLDAKIRIIDSDFSDFAPELTTGAVRTLTYLPDEWVGYCKNLGV